MEIIFIIVTIISVVYSIFTINAFAKIHANSVDKIREKLHLEIQNRDMLLNKRIDGEIDRLDEFKRQTLQSFSAIEDIISRKTVDKGSIQLLESEVDKLLHLFSEIEVSLQNEINKK